MDVDKELDEFNKDKDADDNKKNFKLLIDKLDVSDYNYEGSETFEIKPVYKLDKQATTINVKKSVKSNNNNLF